MAHSRGIPHFVIAALLVVLLWPRIGEAQVFYLGLQARQSVAGVFIEYGRYETGRDKAPSERVIVFNGSAWAAKSTAGRSWWVTNAYVVRTEGYGAPKALLDKQKRWWHPTGRYILKTYAWGQHITDPLTAWDEAADLAALRIAIPAPALPISDAPVVPPQRIVLVGYPLSFRAVVTEGRVVLEDSSDYDEGNFPEEAEACPDEKPSPYRASGFLYDALMTFGSSGSPVLSLDSGFVIGVVRGFCALGGCGLIMGPSFPYAIGSKWVSQFVNRL